jgi:hypothetical protein
LSIKQATFCRIVTAKTFFSDEKKFFFDPGKSVCWEIDRFQVAGDDNARVQETLTKYKIKKANVGGTINGIAEEKKKEGETLNIPDDKKREFRVREIEFLLN